MALILLSPSEMQKKLMENKYPAQETYFAMYSTWWGGVVTDPALMMVPIDDHMVHRGDGVFEAIKVIEGKVFLMDEHLERLNQSAALISLPLPMSLAEIKKTILETIILSGQKNALLRLYISRGPGGFTTNPYEVVASQMYLVVSAFKPLPEEKYTIGAKIGKSEIPAKDPWFARIKSCNYLQNVLMKKESIDRHLDFTVGFDQNGFVTESSTENLVILDQNKNLVHPRLNQILKGTTMLRVFELAKALQKEGLIHSLAERDISEVEIKSALELMMIGTTLDVLPVVQYEENKIGTGLPGVVSKRLQELLKADIKGGSRLTPV
jgi:branched-chain amino acid aminotransferase